MKKVKNITALLGLSMLLLGLAATRSNAQVLTTPTFGGTFTLPFNAQWGSINLPAGDYSLYYGHLKGGGVYLVEVKGKEEASPHGLILPRIGNRVSTSENALVCIREGNFAYVSELRMGAIGESTRFPIPHGVRVRARMLANNANAKGNTQLALARVPIKVNGK